MDKLRLKVGPSCINRASSHATQSRVLLSESNFATDWGEASSEPKALLVRTKCPGPSPSPFSIGPKGRTIYHQINGRMDVDQEGQSLASEGPQVNRSRLSHVPTPPPWRRMPQEREPPFNVFGFPPLESC